MWDFLTLYYFRRRRLASDERIHASPSDSMPTMNRGRERQRDRRERKKGKVSVEADAVVSDGRWRGSAVAAAATANKPRLSVYADDLASLNPLT